MKHVQSLGLAGTKQEGIQMLQDIHTLPNETEAQKTQLVDFWMRGVVDYYNEAEAKMRTSMRIDVHAALLVILFGDQMGAPHSKAQIQILTSC